MIHYRCDRGRFIPLLVAAVLILFALPAASGQGPASLAEENAELKTQVADLEKQLESARARIDTLNQELRRLREKLAESAPPRDNVTAPTPPNPSSDPLACPSFLLEHLKSRFTEAMGDLPLETRADQQRYRRAVGVWIRDIQRSIRGRQVSWRIRVTDASRARARQPMIEFEVLDPVTSRPLGPPSSTIFPSRFARMLENSPLDAQWSLKGSLSALPSLNPKRGELDDDPDQPPLIGPFAEFGYELAITDLQPAT